MARRSLALVVAVACGACGARTELGSPDASRAPIDVALDLQAVMVREAGLVPDGTPADASAVRDAASDAATDVQLDAEGGAPGDAVWDLPPSRAMCATVDAGAGGGPTCERRLRVLSLTVQPGCWVDVSISVGQVGTLSWPCEGGVGSVAFGAMAFRGVVLPGGGIELCAGTQFDWSDGCHWTSAQYVTGRLADPRVTFTYAEAPAPGQAGCAPSCSASAELRWE